MTGSNSWWFAKSDSGFFNGVATRSLKFTQHSTGSNNERLTRTMGTVDSATDFSINFWVKRSDLLNSRNTSYPMTLFTFRDGTSGTALNEVQFGEHGTWGDGDSLCITHTNSGARILATSNLLRDTTAWYNIHIRGDLDNGTASEKLKIYINNVEASYATDNRSSYSEMTGFKAGAWTIGDYYNYGYSPACLLALFTYTDGHKYLPTDFCEVKATALIPKDPSVTYGNGGFRLAFASGTGVGTASSTTVGADTSGQNNHWTTTNIAAANVFPDNPENNFATFNSLDKDAYNSPTEGNLRALTNGNNGTQAVNFAVSSGKWYFEVRNGSAGSGSLARMVGIMYEHSNIASTSYSDSNKFVYYSETGNKRNNSNASYGDSWQDDGDIIGVALDMDNGAIYFSKNGTWQNSATISEIQNGTTTNAGFTSLSGTFKPFVAKTGGTSTNDPHVANFGQDSTFGGEETATSNSDKNGHGRFHSTVPNNFLALCSANLSEPTLGPNSDEQPDDHFEAFIYSGDANATRTISGFNFQADMMWNKTRNQSFQPRMYDSTRGNDKGALSASNGAESTHDIFNGFTSDGFNTTTDGSAGDLLNYNGGTYVNWLWKANAGSTTTNDASSTGVGTIDSVHQANTTAGFSIVTYTGTGSDGTYAHGLSSAPTLIFIADRDATVNWLAYHHESNATKGRYFLNLNLTVAQFDNGADGYFKGTAPSSTLITTDDTSYNTSGNKFIAYCWHDVEGYSKFNTYTGNGSADGPYVHLGFSPALVALKRADSTGDWNVIDTTRQKFNDASGLPVLRWNLSAVEEDTNTMQGQIDVLSNGFKVRSNHSSFNTSGATVIYMAWAKMPEKYSNAF
tara:strand:- start:384 stop:2939 length:2556 start_codon:yes stop_codon:yes gene_type:complete